MHRNHHHSLRSLLFVAICSAATTSCVSQHRSLALSPDLRRADTLPSIRGLHIQPQDIRNHIAMLASDALEGRGTGERGIDIAAGYIAGQFSASDLLPVGDDHTYFQSFQISKTSGIAAETTFSLQGSSDAYELDEDFIALSSSASGPIHGDLVFVGYGITDDQRHYDDYADIDVTGKVVLMLRREPNSWSQASGRPSRNATFFRKISNAAKHGASAVLIANQKPEMPQNDTLMKFRPSNHQLPIPAMHIKRSLANVLLQAGSHAELNELQAHIDDDGTAQSSVIQGVQVNGQVELVTESITARNVIGLLPATHESDEYLVIGAHYDHLGKKEGRIYNGADDNASGTAGVIELAKAFSKVGHRNRHLVFMTFSGEEMGLLGSAHYVAHPIFPLDQTVAMINMDMIGRLDSSDEKNMLAVHGLGTSDSFSDVIDLHASHLRLDYIREPSALGPSDHASFYRGGVPALFFFTGIHDDYHQPGDDTNKVNFIGVATISELVFRATQDLLSDKQSPKFIEVNQRARIFRGARR